MVSDIDMPQMDGVQLLQEVKKVRPDTEFIMLTGVVDVDTAVQSMRMGASDYLTKPFNLAEVRITVERALEKQRLIRENREYQKDLEVRVQKRTAELSLSYQTTLEALATALDTRDTETLGHSLRVAAYTVHVRPPLWPTSPKARNETLSSCLRCTGELPCALVAPF